MDPANYEYQSDFARQYVAQGKAQGRLEGEACGERSGRAALVIRQLTLRFGPLSGESQAQIAQCSVAELDAIGERLLTAATAQEAVGSH